MLNKHRILNVLGNNSVCSTEHTVIGILLFLALLLVALVTIVGYILMMEIYYTLPFLSNLKLLSLSVYCEDLSLSRDEDFDTFETQKSQLKVSVNMDQKYVCDGSNVTSLVQKIVERESRLLQSKGLDNRRYLSCGNTSLQRESGDLTVSLSGISNHQTYTDNDEDVKKLQWDAHMKHSYVHSRIHYHNGEINIPEGQTYYVYVSVHFNITEVDTVEKGYRSRRFTLRLCRKVKDYEQTLLINTKLFGKNPKDVKSTLRVAGVLQLYKNDKIFVKVSNANQVI